MFNRTEVGTGCQKVHLETTAGDSTAHDVGRRLDKQSCVSLAVVVEQLGDLICGRNGKVDFVWHGG